SHVVVREVIRWKIPVLHPVVLIAVFSPAIPCQCIEIMVIGEGLVILQSSLQQVFLRFAGSSRSISVTAASYGRVMVFGLIVTPYTVQYISRPKHTKSDIISRVNSKRTIGSQVAVLVHAYGFFQQSNGVHIICLFRTFNPSAFVIFKSIRRIVGQAISVNITAVATSISSREEFLLIAADVGV